MMSRSRTIENKFSEGTLFEYYVTYLLYFCLYFCVPVVSSVIVGTVAFDNTEKDSKKIKSSNNRNLTIFSFILMFFI